LEPRNEIGLRLYHDGVFARAFIKYSKGKRNNSGLVESMMYNTFQDEIRITTNQEAFEIEYHKVKAEREAFYQEEFDRKLNEYN
jgi:hypothetical protein